MGPAMQMCSRIYRLRRFLDWNWIWCPVFKLRQEYVSRIASLPNAKGHCKKWPPIPWLPSGMQPLVGAPSNETAMQLGSHQMQMLQNTKCQMLIQLEKHPKLTPVDQPTLQLTADRLMCPSKNQILQSSSSCFSSAPSSPPQTSFGNFSSWSPTLGNLSALDWKGSFSLLANMGNNLLNVLGGTWKWLTWETGGPALCCNISRISEATVQNLS